MKTKISLLKEKVRENDWKKAILIAAKFPVLGEHKKAITGAREAYLRPEFQKQLGRDPEEMKKRGIEALITRYKLSSSEGACS